MIRCRSMIGTFQASAEQRQIFFGAEVAEQHDAKEEQPKNEAQEKSEEIKQPTTPEEAQKAFEALAAKAQESIDQHAKPQLELTQKQLKEAKSSLPSEQQAKVDALVMKIEKQTAALTAGGILQYFGVNIAYPKGSTREIKLADGSVKSVVQQDSYGDITPLAKNGIAADGERTDMFVSATPVMGSVISLNQGDEIKLMVGYASEQEALQHYFANHPEQSPADQQKIAQTVKSISPEDFRKQNGLGASSAVV